MSSPIHQVEDMDPALRYAPRWARDRASSLPGRPLASPVARPLRRAKPEFSGDRAMVELQRQLILDPEAIPEPLADDEGALRPIVLRFSAVMGLAALIAWGVVSIPGMKKAGDIMPPDVKAPAMTADIAKPADVVQAQSSDPPPAVKPVSVATNDPAPPPPAVPSGQLVASLAPVPAIVASQPPAVPAQPISAPSQPATVLPAPQAAPASPNKASASTPQIDSAEVAAMIKRSKDMLASGDIISARLLLRRAADAGSAEGALALGATYDPAVIRKLGVIGMTPDIAQARQWYQRAADLGSPAAPAQLAKLEQAQH